MAGIDPTAGSGGEKSGALLAELGAILGGVYGFMISQSYIVAAKGNTFDNYVAQQITELTESETIKVLSGGVEKEYSRLSRMDVLLDMQANLVTAGTMMSSLEDNLTPLELLGEDDAVISATDLELEVKEI